MSAVAGGESWRTGAGSLAPLRSPIDIALIARVAQGVGAALVTSTSLALLNGTLRGLGRTITSLIAAVGDASLGEASAINAAVALVPVLIGAAPEAGSRNRSPTATRRR
jgi:hypothetical protein